MTTAYRAWSMLRLDVGTPSSTTTSRTPQTCLRKLCATPPGGELTCQPTGNANSDCSATHLA
jgi:hypothetical protein